LKLSKSISIIPEFSHDDKTGIKKWEKLIVKTYFQKLNTSEDLYEKIKERYNEGQEVKTIITDMKSKLKDLELLVRKQWHILKKFNLQEKIYREESRILTENEKEKTQDIYKDAIEKLTAAQISGFEPIGVIKTKILNKVQQKYKISQDILEELRNIFREPKYHEEEDHLINERQKNQINVYILNIDIGKDDEEFKRTCTI
jgi:hypothetical protein